MVIALYAGRFEDAIDCIKKGAPLDFSIRHGKNYASHEISLAQFAVGQLPYQAALLFLQTYREYGGKLTLQDEMTIKKSKIKALHNKLSNKSEEDEQSLEKIDQLISIVKPRMS